MPLLNNILAWIKAATTVPGLIGATPELVEPEPIIVLDPEPVPRTMGSRDAGRNLRDWFGIPGSDWVGLSNPSLRYTDFAERELWHTYLTEFQRSEAYETGFIPVRGSNGGRWLVPADVIGQWTKPLVWEPESDKWITYCVITLNATFFDSVIAKVLLLQADEDRFMRVGVRSTDLGFM